MNEPGAPAGEFEPEPARSYEKRKLLAALADWALGVAFLIAMLGSEATKALRNLALEAAPHPALALALYFLLFVTALAVLDLPLDFYRGHRLEHDFGLSRQTFRTWWKDWLKAFGLRLVLGLGAVEVVYTCLGRYPQSWWWLAATAFVLFGIVLAQLAPVLLFPLFFRFEPLADESLRQRLLRLVERAGVRPGGIRGVWVWKLGEKSSKANAALVGWGGTRRIILADTLLEKHNPDEVESILAHELAHHVHHDIRYGLTLQTALTFAGFYLIHRALEAWTEPLGFQGAADFANLPLLLLLSAGASLLLLPALNAYSRRRERAADAFALRLTGDRTSFISSMEKLAEQNLSRRAPHPWVEFLFHSHPSVAKRIAFAKSWQAKQSPSSDPARP